MNLVLIRDGIKLKMLIELDPANDPADEASDLQEIAERFGFDTYDLDDDTPVRTKDPCNPWQDLTDDEIHQAYYSKKTGLINGIRAVIAADRRKNNVK